MRVSFRVNRTCNFNMGSETEPQAELNFARRISTGNIAEVVGKVVGANRSEVDAIEGVEQVGPEGQVGLIAEPPSLVTGQVIDLGSGILNGVGSRVALNSHRAQVNNVFCVDIRPEPPVPAQTSVQRVIVDWTSDVGQCAIKEPNILLASQGRPGAGAQRGDAGKFPASYEYVRESAAVQEHFSMPKRKLIDTICGEDRVDIFSAVAVVKMHVNVPGKLILKGSAQAFGPCVVDGR